MKFYESYPLDKIRPADYNPRRIKEDAYEKLKESLLKFGVVKAVISNLDGTIVAGHQRTKAMKDVGITEAPVFLLEKNVALQDEIKFNLMHNSVETETCKVRINNADKLPLGWSTVKNEDIIIEQKGLGNYIKEICRLLNKYGDYGNAIIDEQGTTVHNSDYAFGCKLLGKDLVVYKMENSLIKEFCDYMNIEYGDYCYEALNIKPYGQTHCQLSRSNTANRSTLYRQLVLPNINKEQRIVDFGAGKCFYISQLKKQGYKAHWYEPFFKTSGTEKLNVSEVVKMINDLQKDISENGQYDVVVLDSVINSITSNDYEDWVLTTCNALCRKDGTFYMATRSMKVLQSRNKLSKSRSKQRDIEFLDKDNFSATFRKGIWTLQKFHSKETLTELLLRYFDYVSVDDRDASQLKAVCKYPKKLDTERYKKALDIEFNLEYPNNYRHNKHHELVNTILDVIENS